MKFLRNSACRLLCIMFSVAIIFGNVGSVSLAASESSIINNKVDSINRIWGNIGSDTKTIESFGDCCDYSEEDYYYILFNSLSDEAFEAALEAMMFDMYFADMYAFEYDFDNYFDSYFAQYAYMYVPDGMAYQPESITTPPTQTTSQVTTDYTAPTTSTSSVIAYTNAGANLLDAPGGNVVVPNLSAGLPLSITALRPDSYYQVSSNGVTYYIAKSDINLTTDLVTNLIWGLQGAYPEGLSWTDAGNYYFFNHVVNGVTWNGYGCAAFAFELSDLLFGNDTVIQHTDFSQLKPGDIIRVDNDTHTVLCISVNGDSVTVCEGNYNSSVHWGRVISKQEMINGNGFIWTRY